MTSTLRTITLWVSAIVTTGFGLALLFASTYLADVYNWTATDATVSISRLFGAVTLAFSVLAIGALRIEDVQAMRAIDATFLTGYLLIAGATSWNVYSYGANGAEVLTWSTVGLYVVIALAFGYFLFAEDMRTSVGRARPMT